MHSYLRKKNTGRLNEKKKFPKKRKYALKKKKKNFVGCYHFL